MAWTKEQKSAIELSGSNIIVSAGAGSGKTAVLSERVIYKLTHGIHVDELLILTFTRAAAEEMKDRIRDNIKSNSSLQDELDRLESSYITTFDSFALSIVKKYHYLIGIKKDIAISDESLVTLATDEIIDRVFDRAYEKKEPAFLNLLKHFTLKNDKPLKTAMRCLIKKIDTYLDREGYLDYLQNRFFTDDNIDRFILHFEEYIAEKRKNLELELTKSYAYFDDDFKSKLESILLPIINTKSLEELIPLNTVRLPNLPRGSEEETKHAKENVKKALDELLFLTTFGDAAKIKSDILATEEDVGAIKSLLYEYYRELAKYKSENDIFTFSDIAALAISILEENEEARLELKNKFKEIMIDEYQDTNDIQERLIGLIANENVYMVGDIKQSIYRFRGSNPNIFKDKYDRYSQGLGGAKIDLIKNFRSRDEVLQNINVIFALLMDDDLGGAAYTESHEMFYGNTNYDAELMDNHDYNCEVLEYVPDETKEFSNIEIEIFAIARDIKSKMDSHCQVFDKKTNKLRSFKYSDAVIILDRSFYFDTFKKIFEYLGIPLTILKDDKLNASIETYLLKNILDLIISIREKKFDTTFKYAFMSVGRSFLYEYTDSMLFEMIKSSSFWDSSLYEDFSHINGFNSLSLGELLDFILDKTDFYNKIYKIGDYENINLRITKLKEIASSLSSLGYTIYDFRDYLANIIEKGLDIKYTAYTGDTDSVKIMTIHKSKGLEYAFCYFADLDHKFNTMELKEKFISDPVYGIITPIQDEGNDDADSVLKILYKSRFMKEEIGEKIRLFYVALTRAREKFYILIPQKETIKLELDRKGTIDLTRRLKFQGLKDFIYGIKDHIPKYFKPLEKEKLHLTKDYLYNKSSNSIKSSSVDTLDVRELAIEEKRVEKRRFSKDLPELLTKEKVHNMKFGTHVHEILEFVDFQNYDPSKITSPFLRKKVEALVTSPLLKNVSHAKVYHEYEFVYTDVDTLYHGSIDLMLEYTDHIDIVDYKLKNTKDENYIKQLKGYKKYIETISKKSVYTYLYSILDEEIFPIDC